MSGVCAGRRTERRNRELSRLRGHLCLGSDSVVRSRAAEAELALVARQNRDNGGVAFPCRSREPKRCLAV